MSTLPAHASAHATPTAPRATILAAFAAVVVFLGVNFVAVRFSNRELAPFWGGGLRFLLATLIVALLVAVRRVPLPKGRALAGAALFGALAFGANFALLYWALQDVRAGTASVVFATVPLLTLIVAAVFRVERPTLAGIVGGLVAIVGIAIIFQEQIASAPPLALAAVALAAVAAAASGVVVRGFPRSHPLATNLVAMAVGAAILLVTSKVAGETWYLPMERATWLAVAWLVTSSVVAFVLIVWILARWTASATAYSSVLSPIVTVVVASILAGEPVTLALLVGGAIVLGAVYVGAIRRSPRPAAAKA